MYKLLGNLQLALDNLKSPLIAEPSLELGQNAGVLSLHRFSLDSSYLGCAGLSGLEVETRS
jgi:hypothetical protein